MIVMIIVGRPLDVGGEKDFRLINMLFSNNCSALAKCGCISRDDFSPC